MRKLVDCQVLQVILMSDIRKLPEKMRKKKFMFERTIKIVTFTVELGAHSHLTLYAVHKEKTR